ncbi:Cytochrome P [Parasponia andersonii]|uniref:Cytochrome P n=1 Tax=Parasponia andersonii TaxID=3476 RepID=A0A2P5AE84_PARAD|nr:Cytochrome P [Parasponia andersonii]
MDFFSAVSFFFLFLLSLYVYLHFHTIPNKSVYAVTTTNPLNVEHMLKTNFENYPKGDGFIIVLCDFHDRGIFNSDGELWKVQRKTASYEFNTKSLRNFAMENIAVELETRLIPALEKASETDRVMDLQDVLERFSFDNVCKLAFDVDPCYLGRDGTTRAEFMQAFEDATMLSSGRFRYSFPYFWKVKRFLNIGIGRSRDEYDSALEFLRDIIISFILAGRDTMSSALTWFFWFLSSRPEI